MGARATTVIPTVATAKNPGPYTARACFHPGAIRWVNALGVTSAGRSTYGSWPSRTICPYVAYAHTSRERCGGPHRPTPNTTTSATIVKRGGTTQRRRARYSTTP